MKTRRTLIQRFRCWPSAVVHSSRRHARSFSWTLGNRPPSIFHVSKDGFQGSRRNRCSWAITQWRGWKTSATSHHCRLEPSEVSLSPRGREPEPHHPVPNCSARRTPGSIPMYGNSRTRRGTGSVLSVSSPPLPMVGKQRLRTLPDRQRPIAEILAGVRPRDFEGCQ